ncbi:MAG: FG-GAP repeat domain-containing protein, partial [Thiobacillaceae bacterium]
MVVPRFLKTVVGTVSNDIPPGAMNTFLTAGDVDGDGWPDVVVGGRNGRLVWLQNPRDPGIPWPMYVVGEPGRLECGGCLHDLLGRGRADIICGGDWRSDEIWWWENPGPAGGTWTQRIIAKTGHTQFHDTAIGDVTGDGTLSLVFTNQHPGTVIWGVPLPADPRVSPWPGLEAIAVERTEPNPHRPEGVQPDEGLAIGDVDGDGRNEVVCGCHWYKYSGHPGHPWEAHRFATSYITTKVAIGDVDGDGRNEIVLAEGDPYIYGRKEGGRLAWFRP